MKSHELVEDLSVWEIEDPDISPLYNFLIWKDRWMEHQKHAEHNNPHTIRAYDKAINGFLDWVQKYEDISITQISPKYMNRYLQHYQFTLAEKKFNVGKMSEERFNFLKIEQQKKNIGLNDIGFTIYREFENTISHRITIVKQFLSYISANNYEQYDFVKMFTKIVKPKIHEKFTDYLLPSELDSVIEYMQMWTDIYKDHASKSTERYAYRNAFLLILYSVTGARGNECVHIRLRDIKEVVAKTQNKHYYIINIEEGKGNKIREITVPKSYIVKFITYFKRELPNDGYYISSCYTKGIGYTNKPMSADSIRSFSKKILGILGIRKNGLHAFRRGYVTKRVSVDNANVADVAKEVGNSSVILEKHYLKQNAEAFIESRR